MKAGALTRRLMVEEYKKRLEEASFIFFTNFKGIKANDMRLIRAKLKEDSSRMMVVKNTLFKRALKDVGLEQLIDYVEGELGVVFGIDDPVSVSKKLQEFAKDFESFKVRAAYIEGKVLDEKGVKKLASIPPKEVLYAQLLGGMKAPISNLVFILKGLIQGLVNVLNQIKEKKS